MEIAEIKIMRGPSTWSVLHEKLIGLKVKANEEDDRNAAAVYFTMVENRMLPMEQLKIEGAADLMNILVATVWRRNGWVPDFLKTLHGEKQNEKWIIVNYVEEQESLTILEKLFDHVGMLLKGMQPDLETIYRDCSAVRSPDEHFRIQVSDELKRRKIPHRYDPNHHIIIAGHGVRQKEISLSREFPGTPAQKVQQYFPDNAGCRIPIVAVTGTNGKTTTVRLIAHLAAESGMKPGFNTTDGIYIEGQRTYKGDCTGPLSAKDVLFDPRVDMAVIECARGGIIRNGLGFDNCDVSIVTNITEDHLGLHGVETLEDMKKIKGVLPAVTSSTGHVILNAEDELVFSLRDMAKGKVALFCIDPEEPRLKDHCAMGGSAVTIQDGYVVVVRNRIGLRIEKLSDIPLAMHGNAPAMVRNVLAATLAAVLMDMNIEGIRKGLQSFRNSPEFTPGRMNIFDFGDFEMMVDYAHNVNGFEMLREYLRSKPGVYKTGIIAVAGDRREQDIIKVGQVSAETFDKVIIRHDRTKRGMRDEEITRLLMEGLKKVPRPVIVEEISSEQEAIDHVVRSARKGEFITICADKVDDTLDYVIQVQKEHSRPAA